MDEMPECRDPLELYLAQLTAFYVNAHKDPDTPMVELKDFMFGIKQEVESQTADEIADTMNILVHRTNR